MLLRRARARALALTGMLAFGACVAASGTGGAPPGVSPVATVTDGAAAEYRVFVVSESSDDVALVRFGPDGARVERSHKTGLIPTEINGPHGIAVSPDGRWYYVSVAHGAPNGTLWKYSTANDSLAGRVSLGLFPASLQVTPDGAYAYVVNFNLHGDMVPSSVSVVDTESMLEVARIPTCTMPHGSRINAQGTRHYSVCMMDDMLVEIDTRRFEVSRHFQLAAGRGVAGAPHAQHSGQHAVVCSPTWAQPSADGARVFVACNKSNEILEIDAASWTVSRRLPAGDGVYNLAASPDGRLLVGTNKRGRSVSVFETASGRELARIPTTRPVVHGVAISPDSRYAFVTVEGVGSEPGTLEVLDLAALRTVATVDLGQQAAGVDFWRMQHPN